MVQNKFDNVLAVLANNQVLCQQLRDAVSAELAEAQDRLNQGAVAALYDRDKLPHACALSGACAVWESILSRLTRAQHK